MKKPKVSRSKMAEIVANLDGKRAALTRAESRIVFKYLEIIEMAHILAKNLSFALDIRRNAKKKAAAWLKKNKKKKHDGV